MSVAIKPNSLAVRDAIRQQSEKRFAECQKIHRAKNIKNLLEDRQIYDSLKRLPRFENDLLLRLDEIERKHASSERFVVINLVVLLGILLISVANMVLGGVL